MMKKRWIILLAAVVLCAALLAVTAAADSSVLTYQSNGDGTCTVTGLNVTYLGDLEIPPVSPAGDKVTRINGYAFKDCSGLTSVTIPSSVTSIGPYAFKDCRGLTSVTIPSSVVSIENYAFEHCSSLTSVTIPSSVTSIGEAAFFGCGITSVTIPSGVTSIKYRTFCDCTNLTNVTLPSSVTSIGDIAFCNCYGLTNITIPSSVTSIGDSAFSSCRTLTSVLIPSSVTSIGDWAFLDCSNLTSVTIPSSVTNIGHDAFNCCSNLKTIFYTGSEVDWQRITLGYDSIPSGVEIVYDYVLPPSTSLAVALAKEGGAYFVGNTITAYVYKVADRDGTAVRPEKLNAVIYGKDVLQISKVTNLTNCVEYSIKAVGSGTAVVSFTDSSQEQPVNVLVTVGEDEYASFRMDKIPEYSYSLLGAHDTYNAYVNGIYIADTTYEQQADGKYTLSFNAYNTQYIPGIAEIRDKDGKLLDAEIITKYKGDFTSLKNTLVGVKDMAVCVFQGETFSFRSHVDAKETEVTLKNIPADGSVVITNCCGLSKYCTYVNVMDVFLTGCKLIKSSVKFDSLKSRDDITKDSLLKAAKEYAYKDVKDPFTQMQEKFLEKLSEEGRDTLLYNTYGFSVDALNLLLEAFEDIDFSKLIGESVESVPLSVLTNILEEGGGPAGAALKVLFLAGEVNEFLHQGYDLYRSLDKRDGWAFMPPVDYNASCDVKVSNGVTVREENADPETVLQVYELSRTLITLPGAGDVTGGSSTGEKKYYSITLQKNGMEVQPNSPIEIYIPIPEDWKVLGASYTVKRQKTDGEWEPLTFAVGKNPDDAAYANEDCIIIKVDHLCDFEISCTKPVVYGDINDDGTIDRDDAELLYQCLSGRNVTINEAAADVNRDGKITTADVQFLWKMLLSASAASAEKPKVTFAAVPKAR